MESGKQSATTRRKTLLSLKTGDYVRWRPFPLQFESPMDAPSAYKMQNMTETKRFIGVDNEWQYGIILDILHSPRRIDKEDVIPGTHVKLLKAGEIDWIFNFELFNDVEIVSE